MNMKSVLTVALVFMVASSAAAQTVLVDFGSGVGKCGEAAVKNNRPDSGTAITYEDDCIVLETPNFWSTFIQLPVEAPTMKDLAGMTLCASVKGQIADKGPALRIICHSKDWSKSSEWLVDLSGINADIFSDAKATTALSEPIGEKGGGLQDDDVIGTMMIFTKAEHGDQPWALRVQSIMAK